MQELAVRVLAICMLCAVSAACDDVGNSELLRAVSALERHYVEGDTNLPAIRCRTQSHNGEKFVLCAHPEGGTDGLYQVTVQGGNVAVAPMTSRSHHYLVGRKVLLDDFHRPVTITELAAPRTDLDTIVALFK